MVLFFAAPASAQRVRLSARVSGSSTVSLDADSVPRIAATASLRDHLVWTPVAAGLAWAEVELSAGSLGLSVRTIVVRVDPNRFDLHLELATAANGMTGAWTIDGADPAAALALNAGQFKDTGPWGWLVLGGEERRDPGTGPLSVGIVLTDSGTVRWVASSELAAARRDEHVRDAFQTYPVLLREGVVPRPLLDPSALDLDHRDARLVLAQAPDGSLLIVLTRFDGLGDVGERVPIGLTVPESVVLLEALGAREAAMLDGGISAQVQLRGPVGVVARWPGLRKVPLGLVAVPRRN